MNICMFTNTFLPHVGGVARSVDAFAHDLRQKGHQVLVIAPAYPHVDAGEDERWGAFRVPALQNFNGSDFSVPLPNPSPIHERIDRFHPRIIHSHHPFLLGDTAIRIARAHGLPLVFTHHTLYEHYTHYVPFDSELMKTFVIQLSTEYANLCDSVIAPSESIAGIIRARGVRKPIAVIPTGVDIELISHGQGERFRRRYHFPAHAPLVGHVGRLAPEKNLSYLARAMTLCLKRNADWYFAIVGKGDSVKMIRETVAAAGLADRVILTGELEEEELADAYQALDLFVFASRTETQGLVLAEAMAAGTPVVALDAPGTREIVNNGENGRLLREDASEEEFAAAVENFFRDEISRSTWRVMAYQTALQFSRSVSGERLVALYGDVIRRQATKVSLGDQDIAGWLSLKDLLKREWQLFQEKVAAVQAVVGHGNHGKPPKH